MIARARSGSGHSKCASRRRSNRMARRRVSRCRAATPVRRRVRPSTSRRGSPARAVGAAVRVAREVVLQHLLRDRRGDRAAAAAGVLDEDGDRDLGLLDRREGDEPGVVARFRARLPARPRSPSVDRPATCRSCRRPRRARTRAFLPVPRSRLTTSRSASRTCCERRSARRRRVAEHLGLDLLDARVPSGASTRFTKCGR